MNGTKQASSWFVAPVSFPALVLIPFQTTIQLENLQPNIRYCRSCCLWKICFAYNLTTSEPPAPQSNAIQPTTTPHQHRYRISEAALLGATIDCILVSGQPPPFLPLLGTHRLSAQVPTGSLGDYSGGRIQSFSKLCHSTPRWI